MRDDLWLDDRWYYGGSPETVHRQNLQHNLKPRRVLAWTNLSKDATRFIFGGDPR